MIARFCGGDQGRVVRLASMWVLHDVARWCLAHWPDFVKTGIPLAVSLTSFAIVLYDRRTRLRLCARSRTWTMLREVNSTRDREIMFEGVVAVYNTSGRANATHAYRFWFKAPDGSWKEMWSEYCTHDPNDESGRRSAMKHRLLWPRILACGTGIGIRQDASAL